MTPDEIFDRLSQDCRLAQGQGWTIKSGLWFDRREKTCCPLSATWLVDHQGQSLGGIYSHTILTYAREVFGVDSECVDAIQLGVDDAVGVIYNNCLPFRDLGMRIREAFSL